MSLSTLVTHNKLDGHTRTEFGVHQMTFLTKEPYDDKLILPNITYIWRKNGLMYQVINYVEINFSFLRRWVENLK